MGVCANGILSSTITALDCESRISRTINKQKKGKNNLARTFFQQKCELNPAENSCKHIFNGVEIDDEAGKLSHVVVAW